MELLSQRSGAVGKGEGLPRESDPEPAQTKGRGREMEFLGGLTLTYWPLVLPKVLVVCLDQSYACTTH